MSAKTNCAATGNLISGPRHGKMPDMLALKQDRKKELEAHYLEEARRASAIFPLGRLEPHENPDFLLHADRGKIGIEVTELCRQEPRAEAGRLAKVPEKAKRFMTVVRTLSRLT